MELESNQDTLINGVVSFRGQKYTIHVFGTVATVLFIEVLLRISRGPDKRRSIIQCTCTCIYMCSRVVKQTDCAHV